MTLKLIGHIPGRGVQIGDIGPHEGEAFVPWDIPRDQALHRVAAERKQYEGPLDYVRICWFSAV
ncbi:MULTISPECIES: hypothetical protein [Streptomyces]|uniref:hypothetical protein n=1 Tax=Streptomyces TaxID=1883 RepID=UPI00117C9F81|nr:hypothetical protein [Streptomyces kasugaensis]